MHDALRSLAARFEASRAALPDLTGLDHAFDHGWIDAAEHEAAEQRHRDHSALCVELRSEVARLRARDAAAYAEAIAGDPALAASMNALDAFV